MRFSRVMVLVLGLWCTSAPAAFSLHNCMAALGRVFSPDHYSILADVDAKELKAIEGRNTANLFRRNPEFWASYGFTVSEGKQIHSRSLNYLNGAIRSARWRKAEVQPPFQFFLDRSPEGADHIFLARQLKRGFVPISKRGESPDGMRIRYHDLLLHAPGWMLMGDEAASVIRARMSVLVELYDRFPQLRTFLRARIRREVSMMDSFSAGISIALSGRLRDSIEERAKFIFFQYEYNRLLEPAGLETEIRDNFDLSVLTPKSQEKVLSRARRFDSLFVKSESAEARSKWLSENFAAIE